MGHKGIDINEEDVRKLVEACRQNQERFEKNKEYIKPISFWKK